jgi:hypothetical protein
MDMRFNSEEELTERLRITLLQLALSHVREKEIKQIMENQSDPESEKRAAAFFERTETKTRRLIRHEMRKQHTKQFCKQQLPRIGGAVAVVLLVCYIGLTAAVATSSAIRGRVMQLLMNMQEQYTELSLVENEALAFSVPDNWKGAYYPTFIPEGYSLESIRDFVGEKDVFFVNSQSEKTIYMEFSEQSYTNLDTEGAEIKFIMVHGNPGMIAFKEGEYRITWSQDETYFVVSCPGDEGEILRVAEGVKKII